MSKDLTRHLESFGPFAAPGAANVRDARAAWKAFRLANGRAATSPFMPTEGNAKTAKNDLPTIRLELSPAEASGDWNACRWATDGCRKACLATTAGRNIFDDVQAGKALRTRFLGEFPHHAVALIYSEVKAFSERFETAVACRLNVASDIRWHLIMPALFRLPNVHFYDYTKDWDRSFDGWHLTYSASERTTDAAIVAKVAAGDNVAVAVDVLPKAGRRPAGQLPTTWHGCKVTDGDVTDQRFGDEPGTVVLLRAKGAGQRDESGFVRSAF